MKKIIAVMLCVLCMLSVMGVGVFASDEMDDISSMISSEIAEDQLYCIVYKKETLSDIAMMYQPNPSMSFSGPGYVTVTSDTPLAVDHDFVCWKDKDGNLYYEGDKIYVDGEVTLYAVWVEKTDNSPHVLRVLSCALQTLQRLFLKALGIFKDVQDFDSSYFSSTEAETTTVAP